ncbi:hypothetical protein KJ708_09300 [bacterium]|nr:hypothetical protein [bacterium]MBU1918383.1 hypothetical protein [bacterium]
MVQPTSGQVGRATGAATEATEQPKQKPASARERNPGIQTDQSRPSSKEKAYDILSSEKGDARTAEMRASHKQKSGENEAAVHEREQNGKEQAAKTGSDINTGLQTTAAVAGGVATAAVIVAETATLTAAAASAVPVVGWICAAIAAVVAVASLVVSAVVSAKQKEAGEAAAKSADALDKGMKSGKNLADKYKKDVKGSEPTSETETPSGDATPTPEEAAAAVKSGKGSNLTTNTPPPEQQPPAQSPSSTGTSGLDAAAGLGGTVTVKQP